MQQNPHGYARFIFNLIAPIYSLLDNYVKRAFRKSFANVLEVVDIKDKDVLDIGTGPGAWAALFSQNGAKRVHGVDIAEKMIFEAKKRYSPKISFSLSNGNDFSEFLDNSFDIVTASLVLHGMKQQYRQKIVSEMQRISKKYVIVNDFYGKTPWIVRFFEFLERSDYKHFKQNFLNELSAEFVNIKRIEASAGISVYFGEKK